MLSGWDFQWLVGTRFEGDGDGIRMDTVQGYIMRILHKIEWDIHIISHYHVLSPAIINLLKDPPEQCLSFQNFHGESCKTIISGMRIKSRSKTLTASDTPSPSKKQYNPILNIVQENEFDIFYFLMGYCCSTTKSPWKISILSSLITIITIITIKTQFHHN